MSVRVQGLVELQGALRDAPAVVLRDVEATTRRGALNVKNGMVASARLASPRGYAREFPRSISYDVHVGAFEVKAEVGPDKSRAGAQGALGNLMAFGSANNAPVWDYAAPLDAEAGAYERYVLEAGERALR